MSDEIRHHRRRDKIGIGFTVLVGLFMLWDWTWFIVKLAQGKFSIFYLLFALLMTFLFIMNVAKDIKQHELTNDLERLMRQQRELDGFRVMRPGNSEIDFNV